MAGPLPGFDADAFRTAIRFAMTLGAPPDADAQATFVFPPVKAATGPVDSTGVPFGPDAMVTPEPPRTVKVACAIEVGVAGDTATDMGRFASDKLTVTLLDEDYAEVVGFQFLVYGGEEYHYVQELPPSGLGQVGVHQIVVRSEAIR